MNPINFLTIIFLIAMIAMAGITLAQMAAAAAVYNKGHHSSSSNGSSSSSSTTIAGSSGDILNPAAKDSTGTTLFDAAAPAFISHCNLTNAQSDVTNGTSILLSPYDIQVNHWPVLNTGTYVCVVDMVRPPLVIK